MWSDRIAVDLAFLPRALPALALSSPPPVVIHRLSRRLVVSPVVVLIAALRARPQPALQELLDRGVGVVAEASGHPSRHVPVSEVACGPGAGAHPQRHGAVRSVEHLRVVVERVIHFEPGQLLALLTVSIARLPQHSWGMVSTSRRPRHGHRLPHARCPWHMHGYGSSMSLPATSHAPLT